MLKPRIYGRKISLLFIRKPYICRSDFEKKGKMAIHVTSGGVTFDVSSPFFLLSCVTHSRKIFIALRLCSCIVDMGHNCIFGCLPRRGFQLIIHKMSPFSFICYFASPLSLNFFFTSLLGNYCGCITFMTHDGSNFWRFCHLSPLFRGLLV